MNKMGEGGRKFPQLSFIPRRWEEEKGDRENLANKPAVKSSPQGCVLVEQRM